MPSDEHELDWLQNRRRTPLMECNSLWARPSGSIGALRRLIFDTVSGIVLPLICFLLVPEMVRSFLDVRNLLFISDLVGLQIMLLAFWLFVPGHHNTTAGYLCGAFHIGAALALAFGLVLLPFVLLDIVFIVSSSWEIVYCFLGLSPFLTSFTFFRNALDAYAVSELSNVQKRTRLKALVSVLVLLLYIMLIAYFSDFHLFHIGTRWVQEAIDYDIYW